MHSALPDAIQEQVDNLWPEAVSARANGGLAKLELIYHLLPGDDRRLEAMCTIQEIADEFGVSRKTAGKKIRELESDEILIKKATKSHAACIAAEYWNLTNAPEQSSTLRSDGGAQITTDMTTACGGLPQQSGVEYYIDTASDAVKLVDRSAGSPIVPIVVGVGCCLATIAPVGASLPIAVLLIPITVWMLYEYAKMPTQRPHETLRVLSDSIV